jgi:hypothetical protein
VFALRLSLRSIFRLDSVGSEGRRGFGADCVGRARACSAPGAWLLVNAPPNTDTLTCPFVLIADEHGIPDPA